MTTVVDSKQTEAYDVYFGRDRKGPIMPFADGALAPAYMRHGGYDDWRDVQAWRYFETVCRKLLEDAQLRMKVERFVLGKRVGAPGEHGVRLARIAVRIFEGGGINGILENAMDPAWREGFRAGMAGAGGEEMKGMSAENLAGLRACEELLAVRCEICGVPFGYEDPGDGNEASAA